MSTEPISTRRSAWGLSAEPADEEWESQALCAQTDPEAFYPDKGGSTKQAKDICLGCPVRLECLQYALDRDERFGIWGGLSERERRRLKRRQLAAPVFSKLCGTLEGIEKHQRHHEQMCLPCRTVARRVYTA